LPLRHCSRLPRFTLDFHLHVAQGLDPFTCKHFGVHLTMAKTTVRFATKATVVLGLVLGANAVPSVNVALKTSFGAPPYLVELLCVLTLYLCIRTLANMYTQGDSR
jgi:hypothetical protein